MKRTHKTRNQTCRRDYQRRKFLQMESLENRMVLSGASPVAVNDLYQVIIDQPLEIAPAEGVIANDTDAESDPQTAMLFTGPTNGTLNLNADGSFLYTPNDGFVGIDSFVYLANDGSSFSHLAAVTLDVTGEGTPPQSADDSYAVLEDEVLNIGFTEGVLANDTDAEGQVLSAALVTGPTNGTLALNADGSFTYIPGANFTGSDSFTYIASDGPNEGNVATVNISIDPVNDLPVAANDLYNAEEDAELIGESVLANDTDLDGDSLTATLESDAVHGSVSLAADGTFTYMPEANFHGIDGFSYLVSDGQGNSEVVTATIIVSPVNDLPESVNDAYETDEDTALTIAAPGVLANDTDIDGDPLSSILASGPQHGTLSLNADGSFVYTPEADFHGIDGFSYLANDGSGDSQVATVTITVNPVNDAPVATGDEYAIDEDAVMTIDAAAGVLANDTDGDGDPLTATLVSGPANGTLTLNADGSFTYTPTANFNGSDSFTYSVSDGTSSSEATVTLTVNPLNDIPEAVNDEFSTDEDTELVTAAPGLLGNDTDADGDAMTVSIVNPPQHGTVTLNSDGSFNYMPSADFSGVDGFSYIASDGTASSEVATVTINVNPANDGPVGAGDEYTTDEDTPLAIDAAAGVLANDTDADGDPLTAALVAGPANGTLSMNPDGSFNYTPNADFSGSDSFTYSVSDGEVTSDPITVTITVNPANDGPAGAADEYAVDEDAVLTIDAAGGVLANDTDADGDPLNAAVVTGPANGTLTMNADGSFTYTPSANFSGSDSFTYTASDGSATSDPITVTITVNPLSDAPLAAADEYTVAEDEVLTIAAPGVLGNDTDADGDPLTATVVSGPVNGTLAMNADGSFSYTPNADFSGSDSFTYSAGDGTSASEATVTINVTSANDGPTATADEYATDENTALVIAAPGVLENDSDPEGDPLTAVLVSGPANGTLAMNADGSFTYTPTTGFSGTDSFVYKANDGSAESEATVTITVNPFLGAPVLFDDAYSTGEDVTLTAGVDLGVLANDFDAEGGTLTATLITPPEHGTLTLNADGSFSFAPEANWHGTATFVYEAESSEGATVQATASITVQPLNDMPVASADEFNVQPGVELTGTLLGNDTDIDGDPLTARLLWGPTSGELVLNTDGTFSYMADEGFTGDDQFYYQASDGMANSNVVLVTMHVGALTENQLPASAEDSYTVQSGQTLNVAVPGVLANDSDAESDPLTAALVTGPAHGTLVLNPDGSFSYAPEAGFSGSDTFTYQASDGLGLGNIATVTLTVTPEGTTLPISAGDDAYEVAAETTLTVDLPGVLANDVDPEGDPLTATMVAGPANGTVTLNADGSFSYTPAIGFTGSDSFTYEAGDGTSVSNIATVTIEVGSLTNTRPSAGNDSYTVESDTTLDVPADQGVLLDDSDPDGDAIAAALFSAPLHGSVTLAEDGSFSYTPEAGYVGLDSFIYRVFDGELHSALAAVTIHVVPNDEPAPAPVPGEDDCEPADEGLLGMLAAEGDMDLDAIDDVLTEEG